METSNDEEDSGQMAEERLEERTEPHHSEDEEFLPHDQDPVGDGVGDEEDLVELGEAGGDYFEHEEFGDLPCDDRDVDDMEVTESDEADSGEAGDYIVIEERSREQRHWNEHEEFLPYDEDLVNQNHDILMRSHTTLQAVPSISDQLEDYGDPGDEEELLLVASMDGSWRAVNVHTGLERVHITSDRKQFQEDNVPDSLLLNFDGALFRETLDGYEYLTKVQDICTGRHQNFKIRTDRVAMGEKRMTMFVIDRKTWKVWNDGKEIDPDIDIQSPQDRVNTQLQLRDHLTADLARDLQMDPLRFIQAFRVDYDITIRDLLGRVKWHLYYSNWEYLADRKDGYHNELAGVPIDRRYVAYSSATNHDLYLYRYNTTLGEGPIQWDEPLLLPDVVTSVHRISPAGGIKKVHHGVLWDPMSRSEVAVEDVQVPAQSEDVSISAMMLTKDTTFVPPVITINGNHRDTIFIDARTALRTALVHRSHRGVPYNPQLAHYPKIIYVDDFVPEEVREEEKRRIDQRKKLEEEWRRELFGPSSHAIAPPINVNPPLYEVSSPSSAEEEGWFTNEVRWMIVGGLTTAILMAIGYVYLTYRRNGSFDVLRDKLQWCGRCMLCKEQKADSPKTRNELAAEASGREAASSGSNPSNPASQGEKPLASTLEQTISLPPLMTNPSLNSIAPVSPQLLSSASPLLAGMTPKIKINPETNLPYTRFEEDFTEQRVLGRGGFGVVVLAEHKLDGKAYAVKHIYFRGATEAQVRDEMGNLAEVRLLARLEHANVVRYYNAWIDTVPFSAVPADLTDTGSTWTRASFSERTSFRDNPSMLPRLPEIRNQFSVPLVSRDTRVDWEEEYEGKTGDWSSAWSGEPWSDSDQDQGDVSREGNSRCSGDETSGIVVSLPRAQRSGEVGAKVPDSSTQDAGEVEFIPGVRGCVVMSIQMEYCGDKTLREWLNDPKRVPHQVTCRRFMIAMLEGLSHIHSKDIVHRDMKPANIFLKNEAASRITSPMSSEFQKPQQRSTFGFEPQLTPKLGDFGLSKKIFGPQQGGHSPGVGTAVYIAPESKQGGYGKASDVFALGIIFFEMFNPMWDTTSERMRHIFALRRGEVPGRFMEKWPLETKIIQEMVHNDPGKRPDTKIVRERLGGENVR